MAGAGGLAFIVLGIFAALVSVVVAIAVVVYASITRRPRRGFIASLIALTFGLVSVLLTLPVTPQILFGSAAGGDPFPPGMIETALVFVGVQALAVLASVLNAWRHRARRPARAQ